MAGVFTKSSEFLPVRSESRSSPQETVKFKPSVETINSPSGAFRTVSVKSMADIAISPFFSPFT